MSTQINEKKEHKWKIGTFFFFSVVLLSFPHPFMFITILTIYGWGRLGVAKKQKRGYSIFQLYTTTEYVVDVTALGVSGWFVSAYVLPFMLREYQLDGDLSVSLTTLFSHSFERLVQISFSFICLGYFWLFLFFIQSLATDESASFWKFKALLFMKVE